MKNPTMSKCVNKAHYDRQRIAYELDQTAMGRAYYGNALRVAKDFPGLTPEDISVLERYLTGRDDKSGSDFHALQAIVIKIATASL